MMDAIEVLQNHVLELKREVRDDIQGLREDVQETYTKVYDRLEEALSRCADECPNNFASRDSVESIKRITLLNCVIIGFILALIVALHGSEGVVAMGKLLKVF